MKKKKSALEKKRIGKANYSLHNKFHRKVDAKESAQRLRWSRGHQGSVRVLKIGKWWCVYKEIPGKPLPKPPARRKFGGKVFTRQFHSRHKEFVNIVVERHKKQGVWYLRVIKWRDRKNKRTYWCVYRRRR